MEDQERWRGIGHAVGGRDVPVEIGRVVERRLEHHLLEQPVAKVRVDLERREVVNAVEGNCRHDRCVGVLEAGLERPVVRGERGQRAEVPAGRATRDRDSGRVDAELVGVFAHPGDRALHVDYVLGQGRARAQPIVDVEADPPVRGHVVEEGDALLGARSEDPPAPVHLDHGGPAVAVRHPVARPVDVQADSPLLLAVEKNAALDPHVSRPEHEERDPQVARGEARLGRVARDLLLELLLDRVCGAPGLPGEVDLDEHQKPEHGESCDSQGALRRIEQQHPNGHQSRHKHDVLEGKLTR